MSLKGLFLMMQNLWLDYNFTFPGVKRVLLNLIPLPLLCNIWIEWVIGDWRWYCELLLCVVDVYFWCWLGWCKFVVLYIIFSFLSILFIYCIKNTNHINLSKYHPFKFLFSISFFYLFSYTNTSFIIYYPFNLSFSTYLFTSYRL